MKVEGNNISRKEWSSLLIIYSLFQFGIMQPIAIIMGSQMIIAVSTLIIFVYLLIIFRFRINKYVYYFFITFTLIFLVNFFLFDSSEYTLMIYLEFLVKSFSLFLIGSFSYSTTYLRKYFSVFSLLNFFSLFIILILGLIDNISYMRYGYAMLPTLLYSIYALRNKGHKFLWLFILTSSFVAILIYGSRGPLLGVVLFTLIVLFADSKMKITKKIFLTSGILLMYIYLISLNGFVRILDYLFFNLGFQTYSITKLKLMFEKGIAESSSGRDFLYEQFIELILKNPLLGNGIGITQELWGFTPHNIFLQILVEFGLIGMVIFLMFFSVIIYLLLVIRKNDNELFLILTIIFSVSFSRLLVSSDLWLRQELWLFISMVINGYIVVKINEKTIKNLKLNS